MDIAQTHYRRFCREHPELPVFFQDWYLDAVCMGGRWSAVFAGPMECPTAVLPFFVKKKWGFQYVTMPHFVKYMGPWAVHPASSLSAQHLLLNQLIDALPAVDGFMQNFHYVQQNWLPFYWKGFRQETRYTYLLDISDLNKVLEGVNRNMRRNIQKAEKRVHLELSEDATRFYALNSLAFKRKNQAIPYSEAAFMRHDAALATHGQRQILFAVDAEGRTHAGAYLIWDTQVAYYHLSGDDPIWRQSGAGIWILWEAIRYAREVLKLNTFDFEGSMLPEVEAIRRQFGGRQTAYSYIWTYTNPVFRLLRSL